MEKSVSRSVSCLIESIENKMYDRAVKCLNELQKVDSKDRKEAINSLKSLEESQITESNSLISALTLFLEDEKRSIRLITAKFFVELSKNNPGSLIPAISELSDRLKDEDEFYYVRARCAETLGYIAIEYPTEISFPEVLANLWSGLSFNRPEIKEKFAKALEYITIGDPKRLDGKVSNIIENLNDGNEIVRYHLCTTLVVIGCKSPQKLKKASDALTERLEDKNAYVRGRAIEALGLILESSTNNLSISRKKLNSLKRDDKKFVRERAKFMEKKLYGEKSDKLSSKIGSINMIRETTEDILPNITMTDSENECPSCGLSIPKDGPPMCPKCGRPYQL